MFGTKPYTVDNISEITLRDLVMYDINGKTYSQLAKDPDFWRHLNPQMTITEGGVQKSRKGVEISKSALAEARENLIEEGYFKLQNLIDKDSLGPLAQCATKLHAEHWPETFCFVYDDFWHVLQNLNYVMGELLGSDFKLMPNLWVFFLEPNSKGLGWAPHRDRARIKTLDDKGYPHSINIWLPITDASPDNGCMYILPANLDPNYKGDLLIQQIPNVQDVRALPANAGDVLFWNEAVYHWGGRSSRLAKGPRISMATNYQTTKVDPYEWPLMNPAHIPPFIDRVGMVAQQFLRFQVQNTYTPSTLALANELAQLTEPLQHFDVLNPFKKSKLPGYKKPLLAGKSSD